MKKWNKSLIIVGFIVITILGVSLRSYKIDAPVADWHSFRQVDTASVAQLYKERGIDLLRPRYHDISNIQTGFDNPMGYRMVEFPLYQAVAAWIGRNIPSISMDIILRILTILSSTVTSLCIGILVGRRMNWTTGCIASVLYAILPYSIFYGRVILPDPHAVALAFLSITVLDVMLGNVAKKEHIGRIIGGMVLSAMLAALAILVKPVSGFLLISIVYILFEKRRYTWWFIGSVILYGIIALVPFYIWREWMMQFKEGIPSYLWLFNNNNIRLKGAWFYWLFAERIAKLMLGYWGIVLLSIGVMGKRWDTEQGLFSVLLLGSLAYLVVVASGNVQHDYYQILILPILVIYAAKGIAICWQKNDLFQTWTARGMTLVVLSFTISFSWYYVRSYYWINHPEIIEAGKKADEILPKEAKVIVPYAGDTTFLYATKRVGWPDGFDIEKKIQMGATHYVTTSAINIDSEASTLAREYEVIAHTDTYTIIDLTQKKPIPDKK